MTGADFCQFRNILQDTPMAHRKWYLRGNASELALSKQFEQHTYLSQINGSTMLMAVFTAGAFWTSPKVNDLSVLNLLKAKVRQQADIQSCLSPSKAKKAI